jgi:hypothetical protein
MKDVLEPLARVAGVRQVAIVSGDGVPVLVLERASRGGEFVERAQGDAPKLSGQRIDPSSFSALAVGWAEELGRAVAPLAWDAPWRIVLVASQGTLVLQQGPGAMVLVVLDAGTPPESLTVPLDGAVARMERLLKSLGRHSEVHEAPSLIGDTEHGDAPVAARLASQNQADRTTRGGARTHLQPPYGHLDEER